MKKILEIIKKMEPNLLFTSTFEPNLLFTSMTIELKIEDKFQIMRVKLKIVSKV